VNDQRIEGRPAFGRIDALYRASVERVRADTVDRFGGECDEPAASKDLGRLLYR
jgi:hypothetical protein